MLIINGNIKTMEEKNYENGYIFIKDGKIEEVGDMNDLKYASHNTIDAQNNIVIPGLIDPHCHLGIWEDGLGFEGDDGNEDIDPITPHLRAIDAINPRDRCFQEALEAGVTTVVTGPGSSNPIAGTWTSLKTYGHRIDDMIIKDPIGMKFALGENPKNTYNAKNVSPVTRMATAALIREQLKKTQEYMYNKYKSEQDTDCDPPEYDMKCEALEEVLKGKLNAFFHAHRVDDIFTAVRLSKEFSLNSIIIHGTESYIIADDLAKEDVKVITGPFLCDRSKPELRELTPKNTSILSKHGVKTAICTDHPVTPIQYLGMCAHVANKEGLDYDEALKNITIYAAEICGLDDRIGSIKEGKDADILIFKNDPILGYTKPQIVILDGIRVI